MPIEPHPLAFHDAETAEARGGLHIVEQSLWAAVPQYVRRVNVALKKHTDKELPLTASPIVFGTWYAAFMGILASM